ncbi:GGDEF domain-containing protein [Radiobacillus kanasensis]|uniref:diguanylate cyclase n=1 Tax=Radiobacillus kanasensis TaxID=2844358 RepID=UPI001E363364|nr:diguanylate cyclase [Radiobacillus kanasensis]UFT98430.1 GGDEF domain-containing protein [Radiobacillus kanasensis]
MYRDLIVNLALIISFLFVSGQIFKHKPLYSSNKQKIVGGFIAGSLGIVLMMFSIHITDHTIMDLRNFAIIVVMMSGGIVSGMITGVMLSLGRVLIYGVNLSSITAICTFILLVLACWGISKTGIKPLYKFMYMNGCNIAIVFSAYIFLINDHQTLISAMVHYGTISLLGGFVIYSLCDFISRSNEQFRMLKESATKDFLTGLSNVREFDTIWNQRILDAKQKEERLSLVLIDIDHFKKINDTYGHPVGDIVLQELGKVLRDSTRSFDTVSRNGGEEFSVILPDCPSHQAVEIAEKIRRTVEQHDFYISKMEKIHITVSIGVATYPEPIQDTENLIKIADDSLYQAKQSGRNKVVAYT